MPEIFSNFVYTAATVGGILALGIVFEDKFIALEDKFDEKVKDVKKNARKQKKVKGSR